MTTLGILEQRLAVVAAEVESIRRQLTEQAVQIHELAARRSAVEGQLGTGEGKGLVRIAPGGPMVIVRGRPADLDERI